MPFFDSFAESFGSFLDSVGELTWGDDTVTIFSEDTSGDDTIFIPVGDNF